MNFDTLLSQVAKPSRYCGNEFNSIKKDWHAVTLRVALIFPDLYEIGMSHQGLLILYHLINSQETWLAERAYAPDLDFERLLKGKGLPFFSLESRRPLAEFDVLGITLPYELCSTNILTILDLAGLPLRSVERDQRHPLVIGGGSSSFQAEPIADFFDAILLGDGEEAIFEIAGVVEEAKRASLSRAELLQGLSRIEGVYVPRFFVPHYDQAGRFREIIPLLSGYEKVVRRILPDLDKMGYWPPLVPSVKIVHDRLGIEIARGCTRGCRFCQAGVIYRPVRERSVETILAMARDGIRQSGFEEMALLSLSTGDYSCLPELMAKLMDSLVNERISISMPSMRVGTLTSEIMAQIKRVRKTGFTLAPEAGTDRLRRVINKGITEEDLLNTVETAFGLGWNLLKLYFMFGLPTETIEDVEAIAALVHKSFAKGRSGNRRINVSVATFVPKPHTPFQWAAQLDIASGFSRIDLLKKKLAVNRKISLKWHDPRQSFLEGVLARGDRRLSGVIEEAWRHGARLDAWSDHFCLVTWRQAAAVQQVDLDGYLKPLALDGPLPWQHLDVGVGNEFFKQEYDLASSGDYTPDCRVEGCQKCGLCDFKRIFPRTHHGEPAKSVSLFPAAVEVINVDQGRSAAGDESKECYFYRLEYAKIESARLLSHLEMFQVLLRAFRRIGLPLRYSQGFNPTPRVSFSPALSLGTESHAEHITIELSSPLVDLDLEIERLNRELPRGVYIKKIESVLKKSYQQYEVCYEIVLVQPIMPADLEAFLSRNEWIIRQERKKHIRFMDARPIVRELSLTASGTLRLVLVCEAGKPGIKPLELVQAMKQLTDEELFSARVVKLWARET